MFDYEEIEEVDPSASVRLNFEIDERMLPVKAKVVLPGGRQRRARPGTAREDDVDDEKPENLLRMFVRRHGMLPEEITTIWEKEWGVTYARRIRFLNPPDSELKYMNPRADPLPSHPEVVRLEAVPSVLTSLMGQIRLHDPLLQAAGEEAQPVEEAEEAVEPLEPEEREELYKEVQRQDLAKVLAQERQRSAHRSRDLVRMFAQAKPASGPPKKLQAAKATGKAAASTARSHAAAHVEDELAPGVHVVIQGLKSRADLNGKAAEVLSWEEVSERWLVQLEGSEERVRCRPENLVPDMPLRGVRSSAPSKARSGGSGKPGRTALLEGFTFDDGEEVFPYRESDDDDLTPEGSDEDYEDYEKVLQGRGWK